MNHWLAALASQTAPSILVTVAIVDGSGPREPGAKMVVTPDKQFDTIGGGHLEMSACEIARGMLRTPAAPRVLQRFSLGPSLGQCCGGVVHLLFERIDADARSCLECIEERWRNAQDTWRLIPLDVMTAPALLDGDGTCLMGPAPAFPVQTDICHPCRLVRDASGQRWLLDSTLVYRPHLVLFGAGHVGAAIVRALAELPCRITWVDEREDMFPAAPPANATMETSDVPEAVADAAVPGASFLVMTHSHALDQRLCEHILRRTDFSWFGLIGSKTKRMQFEHRLRERGIASERLADMVCPIGVHGISGKAPAVIAAAVVAQLLQVWEAQSLDRQ
ncbi:MAG: xanthine dehydrogenase accessory protein XdhC [Pseudomonadota bacterium]